MSEAVASKKTNRMTILLLVIVFVLPVVLAKFALDSDFFQRSATNKGILLQPTLDFSVIASSATDQKNKWRLVYTLPSRCDQTCENALYGIYQVWTALGKNMHRAAPVVVATERSDSSKLLEITQQPNYQVLESTSQAVDSVFETGIINNIFVVDTLDNVVLRYLPKTDQQEAIQSNREMLSDLRNLLKLSRIG